MDYTKGEKESKGVNPKLESVNYIYIEIDIERWKISMHLTCLLEFEMQ